MTKCPSLEDLESYADGETDASPSSIESHLASCPACSLRFAELNRVNWLVRESQAQLRAPPALQARIAASALNARTARPSRRRIVAGLGLAAGLGGLAVFTGNIMGRSGTELVPVLFGDFETMLAAERSLDVAEKDAGSLVLWFRPKLPFALPMLAGLDELELRGGRLCWLLERRFAAMHFTHGAGELCLYVSEADGLTLPDHVSSPATGDTAVILESRNLVGAFWRRKKLAYGLVGTPPREVMTRVADQMSRPV